MATVYGGTAVLNGRRTASQIRFSARTGGYLHSVATGRFNTFVSSGASTFSVALRTVGGCRSVLRASTRAQDVVLESRRDLPWNAEPVFGHSAHDTADDLQLLTGYEQAISAALQEVEACSPGDVINLSVYVVEPGSSTDLLLGALRRAAFRGVRLQLQCDFSLTSHVTRFFEGTTTEAPALAALAQEFSDTCTFTPQAIPTHAKYIICRRANGRDSAVFGGINVGDRFTHWRDFAVRVRGQGPVSRLELSVDTSADCMNCNDVYQAISPSSGTMFCYNRPHSLNTLAWFLGTPFPGEFHVKPALEALFSDPRVHRITVALAYIDLEGARVLQLALDRGAEVCLVMPRHPNVYQSCNSRTLATLLARTARSPGQLSVSLHPDMLHAKALVADLADGTSVGLVGSCNFKRRSFGQFTELCALFTDRQFNASLGAAIQGLVAESCPVGSLRDLPLFDPTVAAVEQWLG